MVTLSPFVGLGFAQQSPVAVAFDNNGLTSLRFQNREYLSYGDFRVNWVTFQAPDGTLFGGSLNASRFFDNAGQRLTLSFSWGTVQVSYAAIQNQLRITITTTNTSGYTIRGVYYEALGLHFSQKPAEYDGSTPLLKTNQGEPTAIAMTCPDSTLGLTNEDVQEPLLVGFPWAYDQPADAVFPLKINTFYDPRYPNSLPVINRPIAPGASDQYRLALRFGGPGQTTTTLAGDLYQSFGRTFPGDFRWTDRRPIGSLIIGTANTGWATNPRGWFLDSSLDVTTPAGIANFRNRLLAWADNSIRILKQMHAQGMITWDIEGERYSQPTTYIGDPRLVDTLAPEMTGVVDQYFQKFRDAGLRVGVTIRPQQLTVAPDQSSASQQDTADPAQILLAKIAYAKTRWGATLFYIDSNGDANNPSDGTIFRRLAEANPDVLLIPEHQNLLYYGSTAPYRELRGGITSSPPLTRFVYPYAFSIINVADGPIDSSLGQLKSAVQAGDALMFRSWFDDPENGQVASIYDQSRQDLEAPGVLLLQPSMVTGTTSIMIAANATDNAGVAGVLFRSDGFPVCAEVTAPPYSVVIDSSLISPGWHTITAEARDTSGNTTVSNARSVLIAAPGK